MIVSLAALLEELPPQFILVLLIYLNEIPLLVSRPFAKACAFVHRFDPLPGALQIFPSVEVNPQVVIEKGAIAVAFDW